MKRTHSTKGKRQPDTTPGRPQVRKKLDWALLLYPACILAAMAVLYLVNDSIRKELPVGSGRGSAQGRVGAPARTGKSAPRTTAATDVSSTIPAEPLIPSQTSGKAAETGIDGSSQQENQSGETVDRAVAAADSADLAAGIDSLQGPDRIVTMLRLAVQAKDHTRLKQCLDELVALGDAAVVGLNDLVNVGGEAGLWAAEALARIGTPMATSALLDTLSQTKEGSFKEELGRRIAGISNHDSWPLLLDTMTQTGDATVARAASASLARMADTPVLDEIIARYEAAATEAEVQRLAQLVGSIQSSKATDALLSLAGDITSTPQDSLQQAAIDALANVGDAQCLSHLLRRLEAATPGEGTALYNSITRVSNPDVHSQLLYAAAGNKEVSAEYGRSAAIEALKNYPSEETIALLERIVAQESNEKVVTAASRTLDDIRRAPHVITAKAESLQKSEEMLPLKPITK